MIENKPDIAEVLRRTQEGDYCSPKDWDVRRIPGAVRELMKKYNLTKTCNPDTPVNIDFELADTYFKAGYEMALKVGYFCHDTERIVRVTQEELDTALQYAPREIFTGQGKDGVWVKHRTPGDPYPLRGERELPEQPALGAHVFRVQCGVCHTWDGANGLAHLTHGWTDDQLRLNIAQLQRTKAFMPPFAGTPKELEALVQWLRWGHAGKPEDWPETSDPEVLEQIQGYLDEAGVAPGVEVEGMRG